MSDFKSDYNIPGSDNFTGFDESGFDFDNLFDDQSGVNDTSYMPEWDAPVFNEGDLSGFTDGSGSSGWGGLVDWAKGAFGSVVNTASGGSPNANFWQGMMGALLQGGGNYLNTKEQRDFLSAESQKSRDFQSAEVQKARDDVNKRKAYGLVQKEMWG